MAKAKYPRTVKSGPLAGMTFFSEEEYQEARRGVNAPAEGGPITVKQTKPKANFSRAMVEALIELVQGFTQFVPSFRGAPFTDQKHK